MKNYIFFYGFYLIIENFNLKNLVYMILTSFFKKDTNIMQKKISKNETFQNHFTNLFQLKIFSAYHGLLFGLEKTA
jgi:hypothetical protein